MRSGRRGSAVKSFPHRELAIETGKSDDRKERNGTVEGAIETPSRMRFAFPHF
jgi:hypothetical protein